MPRYDRKPKRRLFEVLQSQGLQMNQSVVFLSDGRDTVRELPRYLSHESEHRLDWFHITMRLTVMRQVAKGLRSTDGPTTAKDVDRQLERIKWSLWHGHVFRALQTVEHLEIDLESFEETREQKKLLRALRELEQYLTFNKAFIPNYGDRYRHGETISTAFVESTVNQVISKRMVKKPQMGWTPRGAHLLLQVRTRVLNEELREIFAAWYPAMEPLRQPALKEAT